MSRTGNAGEVPGSFVTAEGACPAAPAVEELLRRLLTSDQLRSIDHVVVSDAGDSFVVSVGESRKEFSDTHRRCDERARNAAVFIAFSTPSRKPSGVGEPSPTVPKAAPPVSIRNEDNLRWGNTARMEVDLDVTGGLVAPAASATTSVTPSGGATLRASVGYRWRRAFLGGSLGAAAWGPVDLRYVNAGSRVVRVPIDLTICASYRAGRWEGGGALGLVVSALTVSGEGLAVNQRTVRPEVGIRAGLVGRAWITERIGAVLELDTVVVPLPYDVAVDPQGVVGHLPYVWLSASAGLAVKIH